MSTLQLHLLDFENPECAGLTDMEREMIFYAHYRASHYYTLMCYLAEFESSECLRTQTIIGFRNIGILKIVDGRVLTTEKGAQFVKAMENGGW